MTIRNLMKYFAPNGFKLQEEKDILVLLSDVRSNMNCLLNSVFMDFSLNDISKIIEKGSCNIDSHPVNIELNLSEAYLHLSQYKSRSGKGCRSCKEKFSFKPIQDETWSFCKKYETVSDINSRSGFSPRFRKYHEIGCDEQKPFFRPLEELVK